MPLLLHLVFDHFVFKAAWDAWDTPGTRPTHFPASYRHRIVTELSLTPILGATSRFRLHVKVSGTPPTTTLVQKSGELLRFSFELLWHRLHLHGQPRHFGRVGCIRGCFGSAASASSLDVDAKSLTKTDLRCVQPATSTSSGKPSGSSKLPLRPGTRTT